MLVKAWKMIADKVPGWKLRLVGDGKLLDQIKKYVKDNGLSDSVEFLPPSKDVASLYKDASIFALSSRFEGLPFVLIEAISTGLPIVSFNCPTGPSEIVENGRNGILVPPEDISAFADSLLELILNEEKRRAFSEESLVIAEKYRTDRITMAWEKLMAELKIS